MEYELKKLDSPHPIGCSNDCEIYKLGYCKFGLVNKSRAKEDFSQDVLDLINECIHNDDMIIVKKGRKIDPKFWISTCTDCIEPIYIMKL